MEAIIYSITFTAIGFGVFLAFRYFDKRLILGFGLLFAVYLGLDDLATSLSSISSFFRLVDGQWNWSGKIYSLLVSVAVILGLRITATASGLRLTQRNLTASVITLVLLTVVGFSLGLVFNPPLPDAETIAFQALMPSMAEELAYRGIAPALLLGLIRGKESPQGTPWVVVCITAMMFGVWHGLSYSEGAFSFDLVPALYTFGGGMAYGWLRFSSGSLLFAVLAHGLGNVAFYLTALIDF